MHQKSAILNKILVDCGPVEVRSLDANYDIFMTRLLSSEMLGIEHWKSYFWVLGRPYSSKNGFQRIRVSFGTIL